MKIHVGNLSTETKKEDLKTAFETFGAVTNVSLASDKDTGKPRGFAFVEMSSSDEGAKAILGLNDKEMNGKNITVQEARKKAENVVH
jgi:cold-inducible RNA-binding protein